MDWNTFWTGVGACSSAIATLFGIAGLFYLWPQLSRWRQEASAHKVEGLRFAVEQLQEPEFQAWSEQVRKAWLRF